MKFKGIINDLNESRERRDDYAAIILVLELMIPERYIMRRFYRFTKVFGLVWLPEATENEHILSTHGWDTDPESVVAAIRSTLKGKKASDDRDLSLPRSSHSD